MKRICILATAILSLMFAGCSYNSKYDINQELSKLNQDVSVQNVDTSIVLTPEGADSAFIFYPGALVSYESYLPLLIKCANLGIKCILVQMPYDFAFTDIYDATKFIKLYPEIKHWYLGGHSLGGAMAADYIGSKNTFEGLVLCASFSTKDLSKSGLKVLSVYGSNDKVLNQASYQKYRKNLPENFTEVIIEGGNHGGFGNYGFQKGDGEATISAEEQQTQFAKAVLDLIKK